MSVNFQNIDHYKSFFHHTQVFEKNFTNAKRIEFYFYPVNLISNTISSILTANLLYPVVSGSYSLLTTATSRIVKCVHWRSGQWLEDTFRDPISTQTLLKVGQWTQDLAGKITLQKPIDIFYLRDLHLFTIIFSRYVYIFSKDINTFLKIPQALRSYMSWNTMELPKEENPITTLAKGWKWIKVAAKATAHICLDLIYRILQVAKRLFLWLPFANQLFEVASFGLRCVRHYLHRQLIQKAHDLLDDNEKIVRQKIIAKIAETVTYKGLELSIRSSLKSAFVYAVYNGSKYLLNEFTKSQDLSEQAVWIASLGLKGLGGLIWVKAMIPTLKELKQDYKEEFDPSSSTLKELVLSVNRHNLSKTLSIIQKSL